MNLPPRHLLGLPLPQRVVLVRALTGLGDFLCVTPALRALRTALPAAHITLVGLPSNAALVERFPQYLDTLMEFPGYPGIPERELDVRAFPAFLTAAHQQRFDLALQLQGSGAISNPFTVLLGARLTAGFFLPGQFCPDPERFVPFSEDEPEVRRHLRLLDVLGIPAQGERLEFPLHREDEQALADLPEAAELRPGEYVCLHPGSNNSAARWPVEGFIVVAQALAARGLRIVLTGAASEQALTAAVARRVRPAPLNLTGRTSLGALAALLAQSRLLICNDTGVSHLAAALQVPSVVLFTASNAGRWAPLDRQLHRIVQQSRTRMAPEEVLAQADLLLGPG